MASIDDIDKNILRTLAKDSRMSVERVAETVSLSPTPVRRRIKRLEADGLIRSYTLDVDMEKAGFGLTLHVFVKLQSRDRKTIADFEHQVSLLPEISNCALVTGSHDYIMTMRSKDMDTYNAFLRSVLSQLPGVFGIETSVEIGSVKNTVPLPQ